MALVAENCLGRERPGNLWNTLQVRGKGNVLNVDKPSILVFAYVSVSFEGVANKQSDGERKTRVRSVSQKSRN